MRPLPRVQQFYATSSYRPFRPARRLVSVDDPPQAVIEAINEQRPDVIRRYGGYLELIFRVAAATGKLRHLPAVVSYSGAVKRSSVNGGVRNTIRRVVGV